MRSTTRKRGVRASRARLYHALTQAGLRSQAELAARIADLEALESEPRSLVNRVFREQPVEPGSLERIARALGVDAWTLYLNGDDDRRGSDTGESQGESDTHEPVSDTTVPPARPPRRWKGPAVAAGLLVMALVWTLVDLGRPPDKLTESDNALVSLPGRPSVAVLEFSGDEELNLAASLRQRLEAEFSVIIGAVETLAEQYGEREAAERLRAQWLVGGEHFRHGRWSGVRVWLEHGGTRRPGWAASLPTSTLKRDREVILEQISEAVQRRIRNGRTAGETVIDRGAQADYLIGRMHLDRAATELNVRRAQGRFEAAIRRNPGFARAHAGLCLALLEEIWIQDEQWALEQAQAACRRAEALDAQDPVVQLARAALLRRSGEIPSAIDQVRSALEDAPGDADLLNLQATLHFHRFRQTGAPVDLQRARRSAIAAAEADPAFWRPFFTRAIIEYFDHDIEAAVAASRAALKLEENASILTNLGSFELCLGDPERARKRYERARELSPQAHAGDEFLGLVHYYLGNFETSRQLRQRAIDALADGTPEIHQMWGGLADSRWRTGDGEGAVRAWLRAIEIVERDRLRGTAGQDDAASRILYYTAVDRLKPETVDAEIIASLNAELKQLMAADLSANAWVRVARAWLNLEQPAPAREALRRATATCPGYAGLPEFDGLD